MKIIQLDNFGREAVSDTLIAENVSKHYGEIITDFLIKELSGESSPMFFRLVEDDHKLYEFKP